MLTGREVSGRYLGICSAVCVMCLRRLRTKVEISRADAGKILIASCAVWPARRRAASVLFVIQGSWQVGSWFVGVWG